MTKKSAGKQKITKMSANRAKRCPGTWLGGCGGRGTIQLGRTRARCGRCKGTGYIKG